jgi:phosphoribosylformylglycinamidine cyclo-ligase
MRVGASSAWPKVPPVFGWLARTGNVAPEEMLRVFNCGIGMVVVVAAEAAEQASTLLAASGETVFRMGGLEAGSGEAQVRIDRLAATWPR